MEGFFSALAGYLLGSISTSILLSKAKYYVDIRRRGSGNAGATNMARVYGLAAGLAAVAGDMAKTALAGLAGWLLWGETGLTIACGAALIGHCWPLWHQFRGGKGVSVSACIALLLDWRMFLLLLVFFGVVFLLSRRISVCSLLSALVFPLFYWLTGHGWGPAMGLCFLVTAVVIFAHRSNIQRLRKGEEPPFTLKKK